MKMNFLKKAIWSTIVAAAIVITSCSSDDEGPVIAQAGENGFFVVNEGAFGGGNASLSYFDKSTKKMSNNVFSDKVGRPLGDQGQSMVVIDTLGFIVIQNSNKVEVIDVRDFSSVATMTEGLSSPRYMIAISNEKAYLSDWGPDGVSGTIKVIDLITKNVTKSISTGQGTNKMVKVGDKVYVVNAGGWGSDNTVQVIDVNTDAIVKTIEVGDKPRSIVADANGTIWVAGPGNVVYDGWPNVDQDATTSGFIAKIVNDEVEVSFSMPEKAKGPTNLEINTSGKDLYFDYLGDVYTLETAGLGSGSSVDIKKFIDTSFSELYGLSLDPSTDNILVFEAPNFTSAGTMYRYNMSSTLIDSYEVGIGPNGAGL